MRHQPDRQDSGILQKQQDVCGKINFPLEHLRGVVVRFNDGAPVAP